MPGGVSRAIPATATGSLATGTLLLKGCALLGGSAASTAVVRTGGAGGTIVAVLGAGIGLSDSITFAEPVAVVDPHVTITGTGPTFVAYV